MGFRIPITPAQAAQLFPPVLAAFLSCLFIVIRPIADLSPPYSFLILTIQILYFYPSGTLVAQVESSALAFVGALFSLGYANLFLWFAVLANRGHNDGESVWARVACSLGLAALAISTGWIRSKSPRLMNAARIVLFHGVWLLVDTSNIREMSSANFLHLFYPTLFAMLVSLLSSVIGHFLIPPYQASLRDVLHEAIDSLQHEIQIQVKGALPRQETSTPTDASESPGLSEGPEPNLPRPITQARLLNISKPARSLPKLTPVLRNLYNARRHSVTYAPLGPTAIRPFLTLLGTRIGRNAVAKGAGSDLHTAFAQRKGRRGEEETSPPFVESLPLLAATMTAALSVCVRAVEDAYGWSETRREFNLRALWKRLGQPSARKSFQSGTFRSRDELRTIRSEMETAVAAFEADLLIWLEMDVFAAWPGSAAKCPVARVSLADLPSGSARAIFEQKLQSGAHGLDPDKMKRAHDARLKATSWLVAMLDLSSDISQMVAISRSLVDQADELGYAESGKRQSRIWLPKLGKHWLMKAPGKGRLVDDVGASNSAVQRHAELESAVREETEDAEYIAQHRLARDISRDDHDRHLQERDGIQRSKGSQKHSKNEKGDIGETKEHWGSLWDMAHGWRRWQLRWKLWWTSEQTLQRRIRLSKWLASGKHSKHVHYAFKMALGVMLLGLPAYLPLGSAGRDWFTESRGQWALISYLYVLDITTGATFRVGIWRLIGTISGGIVGYVGFVIARGTAYGLTAVATVASLPIAWIMLYSTYPGVGIVAGITLPPILFIPYIERSSYSEVIIIALWRAEQVSVGIIGAFLVNSFIFPYHARVRYFHCLATTLDKLAELYLTMSRDNLRPSLVYTGNVEQYMTLEQNIDAGIGQCQSLAQIQHLEISLLPKPYKLHLRVNASLSSILEVLVEIRTLRLSIPRRETVLDVLPLRQDLVSSVYITLFALSHASRSRSPLPQFLPSPREALTKWGKAVEKLLADSRPASVAPSPTGSEFNIHSPRRRPRTPTAMDLAALYAFAEREALSRLCDVLEETVELARELFGVQAFLAPQVVAAPQEEDDL